jgi:putative transposase
MSATEKRQQVVRSHPRLSLQRQCTILDIHRSGLYFKPKGESALNLQLMKRIDKQFLEHPYFGVERMTKYLNEDLGYEVNSKRVRRLYKLMNLQTIYPHPKTTKRNKTHYVYPYLLRNFKVTRPNQVWQTDITYIPMVRGFMYMAAIIDVYSRKVLNWSVSNSMETTWVLELLEDTIARFGKPEIHNSDQGSQYTSELYINALKKHEIQISMDGKGRALDNVYIERFWRSIKREKIHLNPPNGGLHLYQIVNEYVEFYNEKRRHQGIGDVPPNQMFYQLKKSA